MNPKLILFIQATLLSLIQYFPGFAFQNNLEYEICRQPFQCGGLRNLSYPFWGGSRPRSCGYPGFGLDCGANDYPILTISSLSYKILDVDFSRYTLRIARQDLWNTTCPTLLQNTTLNPPAIQIPPDSSDENVTVYYDCVFLSRGPQNTTLNQFTCDVNGVNTLNLFGPGPGPGIPCNDSISIPVNQTAARALNTPLNLSVNALRDALDGGFYVQWSANNDYCQGCGRSGGTCVYEENSTSVLCYERNQITGLGAPAPLPLPQIPRGPSASARKLPPIGLIVGRIVGIIAGTILITTVIIWYLRRRRSLQGPEQVSNQDIEKFLLQHGSLALKRYKYSKIKKMTKSFRDKLGQGGYGSVYKGELPDGSLVAVKVLMESDSNGEEFINEVASISRTSHVNIVNLLGFCFDRNKRALVYEFMPNKSLDKFLGCNGSADTHCPLDLDKLYQIAFGVAKGLEYLHTGCNTRIVHFDIKPQNILLDEDLCPKISDFGLAKLCKKKQSILSVLGTRGTIGYIAPEVFSRNYGGVSHKSDVYSYGMMVLEMFGARKLNESTETIRSSENYFPDKIYKQAINFTMKLDDFMIEEEEEIARKMVLVGFWCIQTVPSDRPSMSKVVEMLEGSLQTVQIPPKPVLFTTTTTTLSTQDVSSSFSTYLEIEMSDEV